MKIIEKKLSLSDKNSAILTYILLFTSLSSEKYLFKN